MIKGLFINTIEADCSIWESGRMMYDALKNSPEFIMDYTESFGNFYGEIPGYDFVTFNYHVNTMEALSPETIARLGCKTICFVLEMRPKDPLCQTVKGCDAYCILDPTIVSEDARIYALPRPLDPYHPIMSYFERAIPTIGSFGFATPNKGFDLIIKAVEKEFDRALIRMNLPRGSHVPKNVHHDLVSRIKQVPHRKEIEVVITNLYMTTEELIEWCGQNTINVFLYNRDMAGLAAVTDQAISSGRPLAVSTNETFRHIHQYLAPYPNASLKDLIKGSKPIVEKIREDWSQDNFRIAFEKMLKEAL